MKMALARRMMERLLGSSSVSGFVPLQQHSTQQQQHKLAARKLEMGTMVSTQSDFVADSNFHASSPRATCGTMKNMTRIDA